VTATIRFYYDATIAVALSIVFALVVALIVAVIAGGNAPSSSVAITVFVLAGAMLLFRVRRGWHRSASRPAD
jgi:archaellum biogenesis protein FlaJ (TadC family)